MSGWEKGKNNGVPVFQHDKPPVITNALISRVGPASKHIHTHRKHLHNQNLSQVVPLSLRRPLRNPCRSEAVPPPLMGEG